MFSVVMKYPRYDGDFRILSGSETLFELRHTSEIRISFHASYEIYAYSLAGRKLPG